MPIRKWAAIVLIAGMCTSIPASEDAHQEYLRGIMEETFSSILYLAHPKTGIPYDSTQKLRHTSITNIGLYLASVAIGSELGFIKREEASKLVSKALESLKSIRRWHGFPVSWVDAETLEVYDGHHFSTADHIGNLVASLIVVKSIFPQFAPQVDDYLSSMEWDYLYDERTGWLKGGYNIYKKDFLIEQPWGKWFYCYLGADTRLYSFFAIGSGKVPLKHWHSLLKDTDEKYGFRYLVPGWQGGGLFMQYLPGIFLQEHHTQVGESARQFALAQFEHAKKLKLPAWGWSASVAPTGEYLGWGAIRDDVVTPHASALVAMYFPIEAAENLKVLETLGARAPIKINGDEKHFGFRDSIDLGNRKIADQVLLLDQAMMFLALANVVESSIVWRHFQRDLLVQKAWEMIQNDKPKLTSDGRMNKKID